MTKKKLRANTEPPEYKQYALYPEAQSIPINGDPSLQADLSLDYQFDAGPELPPKKVDGFLYVKYIGGFQGVFNLLMDDIIGALTALTKNEPIIVLPTPLIGAITGAEPGTIHWAMTMVDRRLVSELRLVDDAEAFLAEAKLEEEQHEPQRELPSNEDPS